MIREHSAYSLGRTRCEAAEFEMSFKKVYLDVLKVEKLALEKKAQAEVAHQQKQSLQQQIRDRESNAEVLMKDCNELQKSLEDTDAQLQNARAEIVRLEDLRGKSSSEQSQKQGSLQSTLREIALLQKDFFRHHEAHTVAEKEWQDAQKQANQMMQEKNPLNHPQIRRWLGQ